MTYTGRNTQFLCNYLRYRLATGWTVRGTNLSGGEIFRTCPDRPRDPPSFLYNGYRVFPGVKSGLNVALTPQTLLLPWSRKSRAIPLLPLRAVRPVQSLSACTRMPFTFTLLFKIRYDLLRRWENIYFFQFEIS